MIHTDDLNACLPREDLLEQFGLNYFFLVDVDGLEKSLVSIDRYLLSPVRREGYNASITASVKTNYVPWILSYLFRKGVHMEVVSPSEIELVESLGILSSGSIYNGPQKCRQSVRKLIDHGGTVVIDNPLDLNIVYSIAKELGRRIDISVRLASRWGPNFSSHSRFGLSVEDTQSLQQLRDGIEAGIIRISGLQAHVPDRVPSKYNSISESLIEFSHNVDCSCIETLDFGGGVNSNMDRSLASSLGISIYRMEEYSSSLISLLRSPISEVFPKLRNIIFELGTALFADSLCYLSKIRQYNRERRFATSYGSSLHYSLRNPKPRSFMQTSFDRSMGSHAVNIYGSTCIETDLLGYITGSVTEGDWLHCSKVGSYSHVFAPAFINDLPGYIVMKDNGFFLAHRPRQLKSLIQGR